MKTWDDFLPLVIPHLPGCPNASIKTYLAQSAADFLARSYIWREDIETVYTSPGVYEYDVDADAVVEAVLSVANDDRTLIRTDIRQLNPSERSREGLPSHFWVVSDRAIGVWPTPDKSETFRVTAVLKTARNAAGVEDWIFETWADAIVSGTIYRLSVMPGKEWTDLALSGAHRQLFEKAITTARVRDYRWADLCVRPRPFA